MLGICMVVHILKCIIIVRMIVFFDVSLHIWLWINTYRYHF